VGRHVGYLEPLEMKLPTAALWPRHSSSTSDITTLSDDPNDGAGHTDKGPWVETLVLAIAVDGGWNRTEDPLWGAGTFWNQVRVSCTVARVLWTTIGLCDSEGLVGPCYVVIRRLSADATNLNRQYSGHYLQPAHDSYCRDTCTTHMCSLHHLTSIADRARF
jgi:hypothetical protein